MFVESIEKAARYTRPIHTITRTYTGKKIIPSSATLFFVNEEGYAITCKHVIELLASSDNINKQYNQFKNERDRLPKNDQYKTALEALALKYQYTAETLVQIKNTFVDCVDYMSGFTWHLHPRHDLAILKFNDYKKLCYSGHAVFAKNTSSVKQGEWVCRLGFPFPEFSNYSFNEEADDIDWTNTGVRSSPLFPIEGMITRFIADEKDIYGIELSTPGLKGQSGGPLFNKEGIVYGLQFSTRHLHLGFDMIDKEILINNTAKIVSDYSFIHLGQCIHASTIKQFLKERNVKYYEE